MVPVKPLIEGVLTDQARAIEAAGCRLTIDCPEVSLQGEATSIRQALMNLVSNALKFSRDARPPELHVGARRTAQETILWVQDNGIGFEQKEADKVFGLFERLHGPDTYEGTGVGLAIVKLVAEKHGGRAWAESAPGKGATFYLTFPTQGP
jgi:signal transduction histidine kinase